MLPTDKRPLSFALKTSKNQSTNLSNLAHFTSILFYFTPFYSYPIRGIGSVLVILFFPLFLLICLSLLLLVLVLLLLLFLLEFELLLLELLEL